MSQLDNKGGRYPSVSLWVEKQMQSDNLSLRKAAHKVGVSHNTIASIIKGERPSPATIGKLARAFSSDSYEQLEDFLLILAGYRSQRDGMSEALARLVDRLTDFTPEELELMGEFADFIGKVRGKAWRR